MPLPRVSSCRLAPRVFTIVVGLLAGGCTTVDGLFYWPWEEAPQVDAARQERALQQAQHDAAVSRSQVEGLLQGQRALDERLDRLEQANRENARLRDELAALRRDIEQMRGDRENMRKEIVDDLTTRINKYMATAAATPPKSAGTSIKTTGYQHKVEAGQTLTDIAKAYKTTPAAILKANNLKKASDIKTGQTLFIPD